MKLRTEPVTKVIKLLKNLCTLNNLKKHFCALNNFIIRFHMQKLLFICNFDILSIKNYLKLQKLETDNFEKKKHVLNGICNA